MIMNRLQILTKATQLAHEQVDRAKAVSDAQLAKMRQVFSDDEIIQELAHDILEEAEYEIKHL